ncbi:MAG: hypothetical protein IAG13_13440 [Deltaproteobacteria bacterium]|nr:hypothetical protein [Nannocystaceae bacterium]
MLRSSSVLLVLATLCACKEPKGVEVDARHLVPAEADAVFGFELAPLRDSPIGPLIHTAMQGDADMRGMLASIPDCDVDLANMRGLMATVVDANDKFVAVIESPNIGDEGTVRCIEKGFAKATGGPSGILLFETKGDVRVTPQQDGGYLVVLNKNAIAIMDKSWEDVVFAAIADPATRNTTTPLAKALAQVDAKTDAWFAVALPDEARAGMTDIEGADGITVVRASADLSSGMKLDVGLSTRDAPNAKVLEGSLTKLITELKPGLAGVGLPATLLDTLTVKANDADVAASLAVDEGALPGVIATLAPLFAEG